jgi:hypothetical protein
MATVPVWSRDDDRHGGGGAHQRHLDAPRDRTAGLWLLDRCHAQAVLRLAFHPVQISSLDRDGLHALSALHVPLAGLRDPCLDFVDSLWITAGFFGTWADDTVDCEYTFYALLALGHLSLDPS